MRPNVDTVRVLLQDRMAELYDHVWQDAVLHLWEHESCALGFLEEVRPSWIGEKVRDDLITEGVIFEVLEGEYTLTARARPEGSYSQPEGMVK